MNDMPIHGASVEWANIPVDYVQPQPLAVSIADLRDVISKLRLFEGATARINELEAKVRDLEQTNRELKIANRSANEMLDRYTEQWGPRG